MLQSMGLQRVGRESVIEHLTLPDLLCISDYSAFFPQPSVLVIPLPDSLASPPEVPQDPVIERFRPGQTQPP